MPVRQGPNTSLMYMYFSIPPVTRCLVTCMVASKLAMVLGVLPFGLLYLSWPHILWKLQVWRLVTPFLVLPAKGFEFLIHMIWTVQYGRILETSTFMGSTADFLWMLIVGGSAMLVLAALPFLQAYFLASSVTEMLLYVWSRHFPTAQVSLMGFVSVQAFYLPFVYVGLALLMGSDWRPTVIGILAGHLYYYLAVIYPASPGGRVLIQTPQWLKRILLQYRVGQVDAREVPAVRNPAAPGFRAFTGAGRRLA